MHDKSTVSTPLLLASWSVTTPRWQQIKAQCDRLPDTPRSAWEARGVAVAWGANLIARHTKAGRP